MDSNKFAAVNAKMKANESDVHVVAADLASSQGIRDASAAILGKWSQIDVLVNNAGVRRANDHHHRNA